MAAIIVLGADGFARSELPPTDAGCSPVRQIRQPSALISGVARTRTARTPVLFGAVSVVGGRGFAFSMLPSPAAADIDPAEKRAAQDVASLREDASHPQRSPPPLEVPAPSAEPELPTGCESVALTNALLSLGFNLGKRISPTTGFPLSEDDFVTAFMATRIRPTATAAWPRQSSEPPTPIWPRKGSSPGGD